MVFRIGHSWIKSAYYLDDQWDGIRCRWDDRFLVVRRCT